MQPASFRALRICAREVDREYQAQPSDLTTSFIDDHYGSDAEDWGFSLLPFAVMKNRMLSTAQNHLINQSIASWSHSKSWLLSANALVTQSSTSAWRTTCAASGYVTGRNALVYYTHPQDLSASMARWFHLSLDNHHPLIRVGAQVGALVRIHPFVDGNGRTARLFAFGALQDKSLRKNLMTETVSAFCGTSEALLAYFTSEAIENDDWRPGLRYWLECHRACCSRHLDKSSRPVRSV
jgi:hypothetical protein